MLDHRHDTGKYILHWKHLLLLTFKYILFQFILLYSIASREVTGKSMLLQKIREVNGNGNKYPKELKQQRYGFFLYSFSTWVTVS